MSHSNLTRWIETAEARRVHEAAMFDRPRGGGERQHMHIGAAMANASSWVRHGIGRHALALVCRPLGRRDQ
jgi:hypothetical protein